MGDAVRSFRDLTVWQKAMDLVAEVYRDTDGFPKSELYGLTSQLRRALVSIPANIAEGRGRRSARSYLHFLDIAYGSMAESETLLELAARLGYLPDARLTAHLGRLTEIGRMLNGLIAALEQRLNSQPSHPPPGSGLALNPES
jgi:four helix bundle protein